MIKSKEHINRVLICLILLGILGGIYYYLDTNIKSSSKTDTTKSASPKEGLTNSSTNYEYGPLGINFYIQKRQDEASNNFVPYLDGGTSSCEYPCNNFDGISTSWTNRINGDSVTPMITDPINTQTKVILNPNKFLSFNVSSPECCQYNSNYSTGAGCLCITPEQMHYLNCRGKNRC
jgi:uncharacterized protein (UPF0333 family)